MALRMLRVLAFISVSSVSAFRNTSPFFLFSTDKCAMHLFPHLMRPDLVPSPSPLYQVMGLDAVSFGNVHFEDVEIQVPVEYDAMAPNGIRNGDPRLCSPETGAALVERLTELGARFARHYVEHGA